MVWVSFINTLQIPGSSNYTNWYVFSAVNSTPKADIVHYGWRIQIWSFPVHALFKISMFAVLQRWSSFFKPGGEWSKIHGSVDMVPRISWLQESSRSLSIEPMKPQAFWSIFLSFFLLRLGRFDSRDASHANSTN